MHREYINRIIDSESIEQMHQLKDLLVEAIDYLAVTDEQKYKSIEDKLYQITEGRTITYEKAENLINNMQPFGMKWTLAETEDMREKAQFDDIRPLDFWLVMNSAYNDYNEIFKDNIDMYIDYSDLFINDEDAVRNKVDVYFTYIPKSN